MKHISLALSVFLLFSCVLQPVAFAAYGGGGGGSSVVFTSLKRDVCTDGDKSPSYYDGKCVASVAEKITLVREEPKEHKAADVVAVVVTEKEVKDLTDKQEQLREESKKAEKKLSSLQLLKIDMIEKKVDSLIDRWDGMDDEKKLKKAVTLERRVNAFLALNTDISPFVNSVAMYIQQMALDIIIDIQKNRIEVVSVVSG